MYDNYNYPAGADTPDAPWNETRIPERDFKLGIAVTLSRDVTICTDNYLPEYDEEDGHTYANTKDTDWHKEYEEKCFTIPDLLNELQSYIKQDLERYKGNASKERHLNEMLEACQGWSVDDVEFEEK